MLRQRSSCLSSARASEGQRVGARVCSLGRLRAPLGLLAQGRYRFRRPTPSATAGQPAAVGQVVVVVRL